MVGRKGNSTLLYLGLSPKQTITKWHLSVNANKLSGFLLLLLLRMGSIIMWRRFLIHRRRRRRKTMTAPGVLSFWFFFQIESDLIKIQYPQMQILSMGSGASLPEVSNDGRVNTMKFAFAALLPSSPSPPPSPLGFFTCALAKAAAALPRSTSLCFSI